MGCCGKKINSIVEGWKNVVFRSPQIEFIATERAKVCISCDKNVKNWCSDCGCWIPAKCRSLAETCEKWEIDRTYE